MSDGNKFDVTALAQQRQQNKLPFDEMGNVLLDVMQGTLVCLDGYHLIADVSKTVKDHFGFEQTELIGLSILLLIEDSERDSFSKFLNNPAQSNDLCCVRMMTNNPNEYHQVKIHRKKKLNQDNVDVHSTTPRHSCSIETILLITIEDSSYIDIALYDIHKQEFYTKMNLIGEIIFEDHRGASITGYLPHEIVSQSIFSLVYPEDRLVKLHALWKCVTAGSSKLQWRLTARDGSLVFLQTEYKLVAEHLHQDTIIARNEVLSPVQRAQFDELQTAWKHQCAADIKGNSSSFKIITTSDSDSSSSSVSNGECRISVPSLNMCFTTSKLQPLNLHGNIFDASKPIRPLTIQDYINILIDNDKHIDSELAHMINNIQSLTARYRRSIDHGKSQDESETTVEEKYSSDSSSIDGNLRRKQDSDSIVRGILNNSIKYNHEKPSGDSSPSVERLLNGNNLSNGNSRSNGGSPQLQVTSVKSNVTPMNPEAFHQQHVDFLKKYTAAKAKLESQLEFVRNQESINGVAGYDINKRNTILNKLSQLENIKSKHLARRHDLKRQTTLPTTTTAIPVHNLEQKDYLTSLFTSSSSSSSNSMDLLPLENHNHRPSMYSSSNDPSTLFYPHQRNFSQPFDPAQAPLFEQFLTPPSPSSSSSSYIPVQSNPNSSTTSHSYLTDSSYSGSSNDSTSFRNHHYHHHHHHHPPNTSYPY